MGVRFGAGQPPGRLVAKRGQSAIGRIRRRSGLDSAPNVPPVDIWPQRGQNRTPVLLIIARGTWRTATTPVHNRSKQRGQHHSPRGLTMDAATQHPETTCSGATTNRTTTSCGLALTLPPCRRIVYRHADRSEPPLEGRRTGPIRRAATSRRRPPNSPQRVSVAATARWMEDRRRWPEPTARRSR
jgi:hypothetical protein